MFFQCWRSSKMPYSVSVASLFEIGQGLRKFSKCSVILYSSLILNFT
jgi:hypothetical protein